MTISSPLHRLLLGSVLISFAPIFIKLAAVDPDLAGFYRMLFASISLLPLVLLQKSQNLPDRRSLLLLIASGIFLGIDFMFWHRSIGLIGPGLSTLLGNFQIFFTVFFSWLFFRERITWFFLFALLLAVSGLLLITGLDLPSLSEQVQLGIAYGLLTALFYSGYILLLKHVLTSSRTSGASAILVSSLSCALFLALFTLLKSGTISVPESSSLLALAAAGIVCTTLGWSLISAALKQVAVILAGLLLLLQPALSFVWDVAIFDRPTGATECLGVLLVLAAIYIGTLHKEN